MYSQTSNFLVDESQAGKVNFYFFIPICVGAFLVGFTLSMCCIVCWETRKAKKERAGQDLKKRIVNKAKFRWFSYNCLLEMETSR
mgnify:FL=1